MYTARPELGLKRTCVKCAVRFYDLHRLPALCSVCGEEQPAQRLRTAPVPRAPAARWKGRTSFRGEPAEAEDEAAHGATPLLDAPDDEEAAEEDHGDDEVPESASEPGVEDTAR